MRAPTYRTRRVLQTIANRPGLNNGEVAAGAGIGDEGQASKLLKRLQGVGLIENYGAGELPGLPNVWRLTASGVELEGTIRREAAVAAKLASNMPERFRGRLDGEAIVALRVIGEQPCLSNKGVGLRVGVEHSARSSQLLAHLVALGLVESARESQRTGDPHAWRLTVAGQELDRAVGRGTPAPRRSLALDLMWESGGRLDDRAVSVLRVSAEEPGLSNSELASRVGISSQNSICRLLARLARRGLMENTRNGGRVNVWRLTGAGEELERAIRAEARVGRR